MNLHKTRNYAARPRFGKRREEGFSLIELLVVVAILAILAAIAIPLFLNQKNKAVKASVGSDLRGLILEMEALRPLGTNPQYPTGSTLYDSIVTNGGYRVTPGGNYTLFAVYPNRMDSEQSR